MEFIYVGEIVNTHGLKGELRVLSDFKYKTEVFKPNFNVYIGKNKQQLTIQTHRIHKNYDMITLEGIENIDDALKYKGEILYIDKNSLNVSYFDEDLVGMNIYDGNKNLGIVKSLTKGIKYDFLAIEYQEKKYLIPNIDVFIKNVDLKNNKIEINNIKGLIDED